MSRATVSLQANRATMNRSIPTAQGNVFLFNCGETCSGDIYKALPIRYAEMGRKFRFLLP